MSSDPHALPRAVLRETDDEVVRLVRGLQAMALKHPVAVQAAISALIAEGRRFAETPQGGQWRERLQRSSLLQRARLAFETTTLMTLEGDPVDPLPSAYLDALFMMASSDDLEPMLDQLFRETLSGGEENS